MRVETGGIQNSVRTAHDSNAEPPKLAVGVGDVVDGRYRLEAVIGEGGMGVVFSAMHLALQERVALKLMLPSLGGNVDSAVRFAREARATVRIKSEYVARLLDFGELPDGSPFMVMEYLQGETLASHLEREALAPIERAVDIVIEACAGVADAHRLGIVHRDLKPENLFLARTEDDEVTVKVLDFGISKVDRVPGAHRTDGGMGTPAYAAPEQLRCAGDAEPTADIWSLGVILFELLTGELPFPATSFATMCAMVLTERPPSPRALHPDVSEGLAHVTLRCMALAPTDRYPTVQALAEALAPHASASGRALVARLLSRRGSSAELSVPDLVPSQDRSRPDVERVPRGGATRHVAVAGVVIAIAGLAGIVFDGDTVERTSAPSDEGAQGVAPASEFSVIDVEPLVAPVSVQLEPLVETVPPTPPVATSASRPRKKTPRRPSSIFSGLGGRR